MSVLHAGVASETPEKIYRGYRDPDGTAHVVVESSLSGETIPLDPCFKYVNHSPTGFEWGYMGSGPAQLAFAILLDYLNDLAVARQFYQPFKNVAIAGIRAAEWELSSVDVERYLRLIAKGWVA